MTWPRGRYNGQRIVGFEIKIRCDILEWGWQLPNLKYGVCGRLGPFRIWLSAAYSHEDRWPRRNPGEAAVDGEKENDIKK